MSGREDSAVLPTSQNRDVGHPHPAVGLFWALVAGVTLFSAFVLPFFFPLKTPVMSPMYAAGANNRMAAVAVALISGLVAVACWGWARREPPSGMGRSVETRGSFASLRMTKFIEDGRLGWGYFGWPAALLVSITAYLTAMLLRAGVYFQDSGYFLTQLRAGIRFHRAIYREFEFPYGPGLYAWPAVFARGLAPLGVGLTAAYGVSLAVMQALGVAMLLYVVNALPLRRGLKAAAMVALSAGLLQPLLGMNYTGFRFLLPAALVVLLCRQRTVARAAAVAALGEVLALAVSPELGVAFGGAAAVYGGLRVVVAPAGAQDRTLRWRWLTLGLAVVLGGGGFLAVVGRDYFLTMASMAKGGFNLILEPLPHTLVLLFAAVALAPLAAARALVRQGAGDSFYGDQDVGMMVGALYVASVAMLAPALGRCDALHVFYNGLGLYLLGFVAVEGLGRRWRRGWTLTIALLSVYALTVYWHAYWPETRNLMRGSAAGTDATGVDVTALKRAVGTGPVELPILPDWALSEELTRAGVFRPGYYSAMLGVWDADAERRKVEDMRQAPFVLVPRGGYLYSEPVDNTKVKLILRFGYHYRQRLVPYVEGVLIERELAAHWRPVGEFGGYTLWRRME